MSFLNSIIQPLSNLGHFWQQKANGRIFRWNLTFIVVQIGLLAWKFTSLPTQVPLFYSLPWGESQLVRATSLFLLPTISIVALFIDNLFAVSFFKNQPLISRLSVIISLIISFFSAVTLLMIVALIS